MHDLSTFSLRDMTACGAALRKLGADAANMEEVAQRIVRHLYEELQEGTSGRAACVLVRFFKTHALGELDEELRQFARRLLGDGTETPTTKCLVLLASAGVEPAWNDRRTSVGHQAIPLASHAMVARSPMIHQLIQQLGLGIHALLAPDRSLLVDLEQKTFNVFHVPDAVGSPYVPAQADFVEPYGVRSVLGCGGLLPSGNLFALILFSRVVIGREITEMFRPLSLSMKAALLPFDGTAVFRG